MTGVPTWRGATGWRSVVVVAAVVASLVGVALLVALPSGERSGRTEPPPPATGGPAEPQPEVAPKRIGYVPYWDQRRGFAVVRQHLDLFDQVSPVWYSLDPDGDIVLADAEHTTVDRRTVQFLQSRGIEVIPTVTDLRDGDWQPSLVREMLHDPAATRRHIRQLVELAAREGYDGIDIDYEDLQAEDRQRFSAFLTELGAALRATGRVLATSVHPKTSDEGDDDRNLAQDYVAVGAAVDQLRVMAYDYSWEESPPGPMAPAGWVEDVIAWTVTQVPAHKVFLGVVLMGIDWADGRGTTVDHREARDTAQEHGARIHRSADGSAWYRYRDSSGVWHEVWFEDARSARAKLSVVSRYGLGGAFFWRLGGEDPRVWPQVGEQL